VVVLLHEGLENLKLSLTVDSYTFLNTLETFENENDKGLIWYYIGIFDVSFRF